MAHRHTLGPAGRAGSEHHVGEVVGVDLDAGDRRTGARCDGTGVGVQADHRAAGGEGSRRQLLLRHQGLDLRVASHQRQPVRRIGGVQRHIGGAVLEDGEDAHDHLRRAFDAETHGAAGPDRQGVKVPGQAVGPVLQLGVGHRAVTEDEGRGLRRPPRLPLEELVEADGAGPLRPGVVPRPDLPALGRGQQRQLREAPVGMSHGRLQELPQMPREALDPPRLEQVGAVFEGADDLAAGLHQEQAEVELGGPVVEVQRFDVETGDAQRRPRRVLDGE